MNFPTTIPDPRNDTLPFVGLRLSYQNSSIDSPEIIRHYLHNRRAPVPLWSLTFFPLRPSPTQKKKKLYLPDRV